MDNNDKNVLAALQAKIAELEAKNKALVEAQPKAKEPTFKISEKGAVSVYGLGRFPTTLYLEQWERLLLVADKLRSFIEANRSRLSVKDKTAPTTTATA